MHGAYLQFCHLLSTIAIYRITRLWVMRHHCNMIDFIDDKPALVVTKAVIIVLDHLAIVVQVAQHRVFQQLLRVFCVCGYSRSITNKISNILKSTNHSFSPLLPRLVGPRAVVGWPPSRGSTQKAREKDVVDLLCLEQKPSTIYFDFEIFLTRWSNFECKRKRSWSDEGCDSTSF